MSENLTEYELKVLKELAEELPASPWGAAIGEVLEDLVDRELIDGYGKLLPKGWELLAQLEDKA